MSIFMDISIFASPDLKKGNFHKRFAVFVSAHVCPFILTAFHELTYSKYIYGDLEVS